MTPCNISMTPSALILTVNNLQHLHRSRGSRKILLIQVHTLHWTHSSSYTIVWLVKSDFLVVYLKLTSVRCAIVFINGAIVCLQKFLNSPLADTFDDYRFDSYEKVDNYCSKRVKKNLESYINDTLFLRERFVEGRGLNIL